jgi:hypothetical protein
VAREPLRWSWTEQPQLWLIPLTPDDADRRHLEAELARYFTHDGKFDEEGFWWFAACAIYPAVRWGLTVYLGLKLTSPRERARPLYSDQRALRLAVLPWFREGYMPDWLRRRLIQSLPKTLRLQAVVLLRDILERAMPSGDQAFNPVRLRIAQDRSDPRATQPERDEIFLDTLVRSDPLAFKAPRKLRERIGDLRSEFAKRESLTLGIIAIYWAAFALLIPRPSSGALMTTEWLPLAFLSLVVVTVPAARRLVRWANESAARRSLAGASKD